MARIIETITHYQEQPACKTASEMEKICCKQTAALQCCEKLEPKWQGYTAEEILEHLGITVDDNGRDEQGRYINVELFPRTKPCGEKKTRFDLSGKSCCEDVEPIIWDVDNSAQILADNSSGWCAITGGRPPYTISVRGSGFFLDQARTKKDTIVFSSAFKVYTSEACGYCKITVGDGCTTVKNGIRSINGSWQPLGYYFWTPLDRLEWLKKSGLTVVESTVYLSSAYDGDVSQLSQTGQFWAGENYFDAGIEGIPWNYIGAYHTYGAASGCLNGFAPEDPFCGEFNILLAKDCLLYNGLLYSRTLELKIYICEWRC